MPCGLRLGKGGGKGEEYRPPTGGIGESGGIASRGDFPRRIDDTLGKSMRGRERGKRPVKLALFSEEELCVLCKRNGVQPGRN